MTEPSPPTTGPHGQEILSYDISQECEAQVYHYLPPAPPSREVYSVDDDGYLTIVRTLTDQELKLAESEYQEAIERYRKNGGRLVKPGPIHTSCTVECEDITAEAVWADNKWRWVQWQAKK